MRRGYVRLWRCSEDSAVWQDDRLWRLWCHLVMHARYDDGWVSIDGLAKPIQVLRGQLMVGRMALHKSLYPKKRKITPSPSTVWRRLQTLRDMGNIALEMNSRFTMVTICNYDTYNPVKSQTEQVNEQPVNSRRTAGEQPVNTKKKVKKEKKVKKVEETKPAGAGDVPTELRRLIDGWNELPGNIAKSRAERDPPSKAALLKWNAAMREPKKREALSDIPAVLTAIRKAEFCHGKGWFTVPWLFGNNQNGEFNIVKLMNGGHDDGGNGKPKQPTGPGQKFDPNATLGTF